ncbi:MAG: murein biosynthesis integral membrane protein MurJ [Bdellovibrionia bacterium]
MTTSKQTSPQMAKVSSKSGAFFVASGIFISRIFGLIRERVFAYFFGQSEAGDALKAALKIPNFLQNLFGEGVLSGSFIPVYAQLLGQGKEVESRKLAWGIASFLIFLSTFFVFLGVYFAPFLVSLLSPGFSGEKRELTIQLVRILFPGTGVLVLSAWCLGILNSHRRFFLSYVAPVVWNLAFIVALLVWGQQESFSQNAILAGYGLLVGSFLQFLVQLPGALSLLQKMQWQNPFKNAHSQIVLKNFIPVVFSRGVVQVSAYIDNILASLLPTGAISVVAYAQTIYLLPVSLFGMSISAAELPEFSQESGDQDTFRSKVKERLERSLKQLSFFVIPSFVAFVFLKNQIVSLLFQTGAFDSSSTELVGWVLAASSIGLLANTQGRLYSSVFYALKRPQIPLFAAIARVAVATLAGVFLLFYGAPALGIPENQRVIILSLITGLVAWLEFFILNWVLVKKFEIHVRIWTEQAKLLFVAVVAALIAFYSTIVLEQAWWFESVLSLGLFGFIFLSLALLVLKDPTAQSLLRKIKK